MYYSAVGHLPFIKMQAHYDIRASICGHHIRYSTTLPWSNTTVDYDIHYCSYCERSLHTSQAYQDAQDDFNLYSGYNKRNHERTEARRAYDTARADLANDQLCREELEEFERQRRDRHTHSRESKSHSSKPAPPGRSARFDDSQQHTYPSQYRSNLEYRRRSKHYTPGRHSDRSGEGYLDTSRPPSRSPSPYARLGSRHSRAPTPGSSGRTQEELDEEAEEARIREIRETLNQYSDLYGGRRY